MTKVSKEEITNVYDLAALKPLEGEIEHMAGHLEKMFSHMEDLREVSVEDIEPYFMLPHGDLPREADEAKQSGLDCQIRKTFVQEIEGCLVVRKVVSRGEE